ncbi:hypothetical protein [Qaidamihabitans albus]|uniref:hypothetical protein n=1 Tax=Qaidamihabitans albus TaxID=2795733 RepID=UPI0018F14343|nr:hypothetical protein [Qaidamihabitans albus]
MQAVDDRIQKCQLDLSENPLISFMTDRSVSPGERLSFSLNIAHFVMTFSDLNKYVLRNVDRTDLVQQIINNHTEEDANHWQMFLDDLRTLGFDGNTTPTTLMSALWSDDSQHSRRVSYELISLAAGLGSVMTLVMVEAIEGTGAVAFGAFRQAAHDYEQQTGHTLRYFGDEHCELETGHAMGTDDVETELARVSLTNEQERRALKIVDDVFDLFDRMFEEQYQYVQKNHESV